MSEETVLTLLKTLRETSQGNFGIHIHRTDGIEQCQVCAMANRGDSVVKIVGCVDLAVERDCAVDLWSLSLTGLLKKAIEATREK